MESRVDTEHQQGGLGIFHLGVCIQAGLVPALVHPPCSGSCVPGAATCLGRLSREKLRSDSPFFLATDDVRKLGSLYIRHFCLESAVSWRKSFECILKKKLLTYFHVLFLYHYLLWFFFIISCLENDESLFSYL